MTDRELLEFAAKAAGIDVVRSRLADPLSRDFLVNASARNPYQVSGPWNPFTDDGDALRLAVKLRIDVAHTDIHLPQVHALADAKVQVWEDSSGDPYAATRRAIVMAAAEIGRSMT